MKFTLMNLQTDANMIWKSSLTPEEKYGRIFSKNISGKVFKLLNLDYCDPDTTYEEDVDAFMYAFNQKMDELYEDGEND